MIVADWVLNYYCPCTEAVTGVVLSGRFVQLLSDSTQNVLSDGHQRPDIVSEGFKGCFILLGSFFEMFGIYEAKTMMRSDRPLRLRSLTEHIKIQNTFIQRSLSVMDK